MLWFAPVWTYAPLIPNSSVLPALEGGAGLTPADFDTFHGMLLAAIAAAGVGFNAWFSGILILRHQARAGKVALWLKVLPLMLLIPCAVHFAGMRNYHNKTIALNQEWMKNYLLRKRTVKKPAAILPQQRNPTK
ncbi:hypothetical protein BEN47_02210 [Hymenobacter lapidarius]|uniref:Uncharacterized protein n=2 Tax=Hymenobacter lapidarius TaxID=1908237 RepID=A0A1G1T2T5_9BACT|nr:hypothetical protein BEN47_02210 [Hymenobacter lapidarius]